MTALLNNATNERDCALVRRHREGDPTAFAELYELYHPHLLRYVRRRVREQHVAEDIAHETFARALAALPDLRNPARFYPWISAIARHLVIRHYRETGQVSTVAHLDAGESEAPEHVLLRRLDHDNMQVALNRLRDRYREVLRLREDEELSYDDIAARLGLSQTVVTVLLHRARRALRREYLAVTEPERIAVFLPLLHGAADTLRRLRDRALQAAAYLPDATVLTTSLAVTAFGVSSYIGWDPTFTPDLPTRQDTPLVAVPSSSAHGKSVIGHPRFGPPPAQTTERRGLPIPRYQPDVTIDGQETRRGRAQDRHMPYYSEVGDLSIGVDPETMRRDLEALLAGDTTWMENR